MRVCHINLSAELGGGTLQTLALIEAIGNRIPQTLVVQRNSPLHQAARPLNWLELRPVANSLLAAARASGGADLLHIHEGRSVTVAAVRSLFSGVPFVVVRGVWQSPGSSWFSRWRYERAGAVVAISNPIAQRMRSYSRKLNLVVIPDCLRPLAHDVQRAKKLRDAEQGKLIVGHVGSLQDAVKGQSLILDAARAMSCSHPQVVFWLIGDGPDQHSLKRLAQDLDNVRFLGWADQVGDYYAAMDLFVFPSRKEGLGSALLEAMSFSLPVVAARVGGIPDLVSHEENGLLVDAGDAQALAAALIKLAGAPELRQRMGAAGSQRAAGFSPQRRAERYLTVYRQVLQGGDVSTPA